MNDLRNAGRQLARRPGLAIVVVAMLALGIGATTGIYSVLYSVLLRPLDVPDPSSLVNLGAPGPKPGSNSCSNIGNCDDVFSYPMFRDLEARQSVFTGLAAHRDFAAAVSYDGSGFAGDGLLVSGRYFSVLGLTPAAGRLIAPEDEPGLDASRVAVLGHRYWRNELGGSPAVIGQSLRVNGELLTIIGVAPEGFDGTTIGNPSPDVFVPLTLRWLMQPTVPRDVAEERRAYWLYLFGRPRPGVSVERARSELNGLYSGIINDVELPLNEFLPDDQLAEFGRKEITLSPGAKGQSQVPDFAAAPLAMLLGLTALLLLIICVNIANLLMTRAAARSGELAVRAMIGANRGRILRQLLAESALLAITGGALALPVAVATLRGIVSLGPPEAESLGFSPAVVGFTVAVTFGTLLIFSLVPSLQAARPDLAVVVKGRGTQMTAGRGTSRLRSLLVAAQVAFSLVLLGLAGLFVQSLRNIGDADLGMQLDSVVAFSISPRLNGLTEAESMRLFERLDVSLATEPGVVSASSSTIPLLTNTASGSSITVEGFDSRPGDDTDAEYTAVGLGFFQTLAIPLLQGRDFNEADTATSPRVALVNEAFARKFGLGADAVGRRLGMFGAAEPDIEIIGVVANSKYASVKDAAPPQVFLARSQQQNINASTFYVQTSIDADRMLTSLRALVARLAPGLPIARLATMDRIVDENVFLDRLVAILAASFAVLATVVAATGLYAVLSYHVALRTRELGLRLALGATPERLQWIVVRQVGLMALVGGLAGLAGAVALGRLAEALLFGLAGYDPLVLGAATVLLGAVVFTAAFVPARRASGIGAMEALRHE